MVLQSGGQAQGSKWAVNLLLVGLVDMECTDTRSIPATVWMLRRPARHRECGSLSVWLEGGVMSAAGASEKGQMGQLV
jgi:hypothetical protein